jgi:hypothetical protein
MPAAGSFTSPGKRGEGVHSHSEQMDCLVISRKKGRPYYQVQRNG